MLMVRETHIGCFGFFRTGRLNATWASCDLRGSIAIGDHSFVRDLTCLLWSFVRLHGDIVGTIEQICQYLFDTKTQYIPNIELFLMQAR